MSRIKWTVLIVLLLAVAGWLLFPCIQQVRDSEGWVGSQMSLKQIGLAIQNYHDLHKKLPPAVVVGKDGTPLYSWRVLLLPFLEEDRLFREFNLDEPWDSAHNKRFLEKTPRCYLPYYKSDDLPGFTPYQVFVGPGTSFERDRLTFKDFPDGLLNTLLVVEASEPVLWTKPTDLVFDPKGPLPPLGGLFAKPVHLLCREVDRKPGFAALFADGSTRFIPDRAEEKTVRALITRNGGEEVQLSALD
jgi:hypothetical protein